ncbi:MAG: sodium-dependent transporter [Pseudomonadota bacterium]|nr:sodium-dependent transporter [Pseudomonadota bacterium]
MVTQKRKSIHGQWSSKLIFVLSATGAAVGLGNIWKFPYEVTSNGGSAFVLTYIFCLLLLGIPLLTAEMCLGKLGRANPIQSIYNIAKDNNKSKKWSFLGWLNIMTLTLVLSFYSVVAGWALKYFIFSCKGYFSKITPNELNIFWQQTVSNPFEIIFFHAIFMILTISVVVRGISKGIESANKILMPLLFLFLISLVIFSSTTPGFPQGWDFMFEFRYQDFNFSTLLKAFGQTCFTLAIGAGCMLVYGAYVSDKTNLGKTSFIIAMINLFVALATGLAIFPLTFSYNLEPIGGPGLIFQTLPIAFGNIYLGQVFGSIFFALIIFAAWTSSISMAEPIVIMLIERFKCTRIKAGIFTGISTWILGIFSALSFNILENVSVLGYRNFFVAITDITTDFLLPLGILGYTIFIGWQVDIRSIQDTLKFKKVIYAKIWYFLVKLIAPVVVILILVEPLI